VGSVDAIAVAVSGASLPFIPFREWVSAGALGMPGAPHASTWPSMARVGGVGGGVSDMVSTVLPRQSHPVLPPPILVFVELPSSC